MISSIVSCTKIARNNRIAIPISAGNYIESCDNQTWSICQKKIPRIFFSKTRFRQKKNSFPPFIFLVPKFFRKALKKKYEFKRDLLFTGFGLLCFLRDIIVSLVENSSTASRCKNRQIFNFFSNTAQRNCLFFLHQLKNKQNKTKSLRWIRNKNVAFLLKRNVLRAIVFFSKNSSEKGKQNKRETRGVVTAGGKHVLSPPHASDYWSLGSHRRRLHGPTNPTSSSLFFCAQKERKRDGPREASRRGVRVSLPNIFKLNG